MRTLAGKMYRSVMGNKLMFAVMIALMLTVPQMAFAQSQTIEIDFTVLFGQINQWIVQFLPIMAIGIGIAVAIAIINFVGNRITDAFK